MHFRLVHRVDVRDTRLWAEWDDEAEMVDIYQHQYVSTQFQFENPE